MNKYGAKKTVVDGITFDSLREARRYGELKLLEKAGKIRDLRVHPSFDLKINDQHIGKYTADFQYLEREKVAPGRFVWITEDVKSKPSKTEAYRLRKKLMKALYGIDIREVF